MNNKKLVLLIVLTTACTHIYKPDVYPKFEPILEFSSSASITLQNGQPSTKPITYASQGLSTWKANLHEWTDVAIALTDRELKKRGVHVVDDTKNSMSLSVTSATLEIGWVISTSLVTLYVETSDGYTTRYIGENKSGRPVGIIYLGEGALMRAVVKMLNDPNIKNFLIQ